MIDVLSLDYGDLERIFRERYGKGEYHSGALFRRVYRLGTSECSDLDHFVRSPALAEKVRRDFPVLLPEEMGCAVQGAVRKLRLDYGNGAAVDTVLIPMRTYATLCVSSQAGCRRRCAFCETGAGPFVRSLTAGEIVGQVLYASLKNNTRPGNVVFMGMGEPMDNIEAVLKAASILSDQRGLNIPYSSMTVSTSGHVPGIRLLAERASVRHFRAPRALRLAVSLNSAVQGTREILMPIAREYPLEDLRRALLDYPLRHSRDAIFIAYVILPGINDSRADADALSRWLRGLRAAVNLIPYNSSRSGGYREPTRREARRFADHLRDLGVTVRLRDSKGSRLKAACGQLSSRSDA